MTYLTSLSWLLITAIAIPTTTAASDCNQTAALEAADAYVSAQTSGSLTALQPYVSANWTYLENNVALSPTASVLVKPLKIDHRRTNIDTTSCATYTELISSNSTNPYVIGTQLRHSVSSSSGTDDEMKIISIDTIASTTNSWIFNASKTLDYVLHEKWDPIPENKRDSRELIQAAGDAYLSMWNNATASDAVPWGTPCVRLEGSAYTGTGSTSDSCKPGIPSNHSQAPNTHRRYVIDEAMGSVSIFCVWEHMMMAADSHEFRLEGGKLRYVHTMTVCGGQVCKL